MTTTIDALDLPFDEAIAYLRQKANVTSQNYTDVWGKANVKSFTVAGAATDALVADFRAEVAKALEQGISLQEFRKGFDGIVAKHGWDHTGTAGWRARVIYETNLGMAYSAGRYAQQTEPETLAAFPYWQYVHSGALHPRKQHLAWNGLTLRADDPFWQTHYPPNGWRCGCRTSPVSARGLQRMGKSAPDTAPPIRRIEHTNRKTGEVHEVPEGIDPGFDYNVGQEWTGKAPRIPERATLRTRPVAGGTGGSGVASPEEVEDFARRVLAGETNDRAASIVAARVPTRYDDLLRRGGPSTRDVELSAFRVLKVAGRAEEMGGATSAAHPEVRARDWGRLQEMIDRGEAWWEGSAGLPQLSIIHPFEADRTMLAVIRRVTAPDGSGRLIVPTFQQVGERRIKRLMKKLMKLPAE